MEEAKLAELWQAKQLESSFGIAFDVCDTVMGGAKKEHELHLVVVGEQGCSGYEFLVVAQFPNAKAVCTATAFIKRRMDYISAAKYSMEQWNVRLLDTEDNEEFEKICIREIMEYEEHITEAKQSIAMVQKAKELTTVKVFSRPRQS